MHSVRGGVSGSPFYLGHNVHLLFPACIGLIAAGLAGVIFKEHAFWSRWGPFFFLALGAAPLILRAFPSCAALAVRPAPRIVGVIVITTASAAFLFLTALELKSVISTRPLGLASVKSAVFIVVAVALAAAYPLVRVARRAEIGRWNGLVLSLLGMILLLKFTSSFMDMRSLWKVANALRGYDANPIAAAVICAFLVGAVCWAIPTAHGPYADAKSDLSVPKLLSLAATFVILLMLSFRSDSLFVEGAEFHWEYFTGVVRSIRDGAVLLWDAPSQYGFLNILLASAIPGSSWQGFYVFQSVLLAFTGLCILLTVLVAFGTSWRALFLAGLVTLTVYLADPELIGPQPYPSSSAVRFGPSVIAFLYFASTSLRPRLIKNQWWRRAAAVVWAGGVLWSAESAVYVTTIVTCSVAAIFSTIAAMEGRKAAQSYIREFTRASSIALIGPMLVVIAVYWLTLGALPDFRMFVVFGIKYAAGFGSLPLKPTGFIWIIVIPILLTLGIAWQYVRRDPPTWSAVGFVAAAASLWAWLSYVVGRAVPDNVIALSPEIALVLCVVVALARREDLPFEYLLSRGIAVIFLSIVAMSIFAHEGFSRALSAYAGFSADVGKNKRPADRRLVELLSAFSDRGKLPIVYYGWAASMPALPDDVARYYEAEKIWLPVPLSLLEQPVPRRIQELVIQRFTSRQQRDGYILLAKTESFPDRFTQWMSLLDRTHRCGKLGETTAWALYFCRSRSQRVSDDWRNDQP